MNDAISVAEPGRRIDLTQQPDFAIGNLRVIPRACEVVAGDARVRLQPRVMQVLIALARTGGELVSRRSLVQACWGDVVVGDDSINRCIQRLRRLSQEEARGAFVIETVPRLGYKLNSGETEPVDDAPTDAPEDAARLAARARRRWPVAAGGLFIVLVLAFTAGLISRTGAARWTIARSEILVSTPLIERYPALSPDGTMLAYSAGADIFGRHILIKRLSGGEPIQLTNDGRDDIAPSWSHDGSRIAYSTYRQGEPCRIMVAPVPAGLATEVGRCLTAERSQIKWNPSSNSLLFEDATTGGESLRIFSLDLASGRRQPITHPPAGANDEGPILSPDGHQLLFARTLELASDSRLVVHDLRTGKEKVLAKVPPSAQPGAWAEDSKSVFITAGAREDSAIWSFPVDGGPGERLQSLPIDIGRMSTGPGGLLAVEYNTVRLNLATPSSSGQPDIIDPANGRTWSPAFAPDGTLAMGSDRAGEEGIWLMAPGGRGRLLLTTGEACACSIAWTPDGSKLAYVSNEGAPVVHIVTAAAAEVVRIRVPGIEAGQPSWLSNSRSLVFPARDGGGWRIWQADLDQPDRPRPVTGYGWVDARTDGDVLYGVRTSQPGIWRIGPPPLKVSDDYPFPQQGAWTIFHHQIIFADPTRLDHPRLLSTPITGGPRRVLADLPKSSVGADFAINPRTGAPVYVEEVGADTDIELFHLARR